MAKRKPQDMTNANTKEDSQKKRPHTRTYEKRWSIRNSKYESEPSDHDEESDGIPKQMDDKQYDSQKNALLTPSNLEKCPDSQKSHSVTFLRNDLHDEATASSSARRSPRNLARIVKDARITRSSSRQQERIAVPPPDMPDSLTPTQRKVEVILPRVKTHATMDTSPSNSLTQEVSEKLLFVELPSSLPDKFLTCLEAQKSAVLEALQEPLAMESLPTYLGVKNQLQELAIGSVDRHEGNSCLILGPRGSGKSRVCEYVRTTLNFNDEMASLSMTYYRQFLRPPKTFL
jgi:hypothetical protein